MSAVRFRAAALLRRFRSRLASALSAATSVVRPLAASGVCCCGYEFLGIEISYSYQCSAYGDYDHAYVTKYYADNKLCNGDNTEVVWSVSDCDYYSDYTSQDNCEALANSAYSGYACTWNSATTNALATVAAVAAVVGYAM